MNPVGLLSSRPTQTTAASLSSKPANQESVVPVFAAMVFPGNDAPSRRPVPSATTLVMAQTVE